MGQSTVELPDYLANPNTQIDDVMVRSEYSEGPAVDADGITLDEMGNVYSVSYRDNTIYVFDSTGVEIGKIVVDAANVSNCIFGGPEGKTLYITGDGVLRKVELKVKGRNPFNNSMVLYDFYPGENGSEYPEGLERGTRTNDVWLHLSSASSNPYELNLYGILGEKISSGKMERGMKKVKFSIPGTFVLPSAPYFVEMKDSDTGKTQIQKLFLN